MHNKSALWAAGSQSDPLDMKDRKFRLNVHVLIEKEDDLFTAHCLEFDIVADGQTLQEAQENIVDAIVDHITFCLEVGNVENILNPAPKEFWNKFYFESREISKPVKLPMKKVHSIIDDVSFGQLQAA